MSNVDVIAVPQGQDTALMSEFTAEAWLDPDLARAFDADKARTIARFARERGYQVPGLDEIEDFELPGNPIGDFEYSENVHAPHAGNTLEPTCTSDCWPTPSLECPSVRCSADCPTATCTVAFCVP